MISPNDCRKLRPVFILCTGKKHATLLDTKQVNENTTPKEGTLSPPVLSKTCNFITSLPEVYETIEKVMDIPLTDPHGITEEIMEDVYTTSVAGEVNHLREEHPDICLEPNEAKYFEHMCIDADGASLDNRKSEESGINDILPCEDSTSQYKSAKEVEVSEFESDGLRMIRKENTTLPFFQHLEMLAVLMYFIDICHRNAPG